VAETSGLLNRRTG